MDTHLDQLAGRFWDLAMEAEPLWATALGDHRFDRLLPVVSDEELTQVLDRLTGIEDKVTAINPENLDEDDQVTHGLLLAAIDSARIQATTKVLLAPVDALIGPHVSLQHAPARTQLTEPAHAEAILERYRKIPEYLDKALDRNRRDAEAGQGPTKSNVEKVLGQLDGYLSLPVDTDPFSKTEPPKGWTGAEQWRTELNSIVSDVIRPAFSRFREGIATHVAPHARPDERPGLAYMPEGPEAYRSLIRLFTSLDLSAEEIHEIGLREATDKIPREIAQAGDQAFGTSDVTEIFDRLRSDTTLRYSSAAEMVSHARGAVERAWESAQSWFGVMPKAPCDVVEIPAALAPAQPPAYYFPPAPDGSRPGQYYLNTHAPETRQRFDAESMHFHEAVPGHHLQITIASELEGLPEFRKHTLEFAYAEGWGLYAERLADEMGLYSSDVDRLGMLSSDAWRACRLVVDTGLHLLGWTRQQAIDFLLSWSAISPEVAIQEIDRYIGMPGQALAYKIGQREILRLREEARRRLGSRFDIRAFHDVVLAKGALTLGVLEGQVMRWIGGFGA